MDEPPPTTAADWRAFLRHHRTGHGPAEEHAVRAAETGLGVRLPPSLRNFYLVSDGWGDVDPALSELLPVGGVGWFRELEGWLLDAWSGPEMDHFAEWSAVLERCLLITGPADGDYWALDTDAPEGAEWTAYRWAAGDGEEPEPFPSFGALIARVRDEARE